MPRCALLCLRHRQGSVGAVCGSSDIRGIMLLYCSILLALLMPVYCLHIIMCFSLAFLVITHIDLCALWIVRSISAFYSACIFPEVVPVGFPSAPIEQPPGLKYTFVL